MEQGCKAQSPWMMRMVSTRCQFANTLVMYPQEEKKEEEKTLWEILSFIHNIFLLI